MIRTKYFIIAIFVCAVIVLGIGIWTMSRPVQPSVSPEQIEFLVAPQDTYGIRPHDTRSDSEEREVFISKVRSELLQQPVRKKEVEEVPVPVVKEEVPTTTLSYPEIKTDTITTSTTPEIPMVPMSSGTPPVVE